MEPTRVLVVAHKTAATPALIEAVRERAARGPCNFTLLVPNTVGGLAKVMDPEDQPEDEARDVLALAVPLLEQAAGGPVAGAATLGLVVALGVFPATPRYLVPVGGMIIGNAMTSAAVALNRLGDDVAAAAREIEATLALGATASLAVRPLVRRSLRSAVIPLVDQTKTTGLIAFPGTMVGMLLAGAAPVDAVRLQLVLLYVLLGGVSLAALVAVMLAHRSFFTPAHQLRELPERAEP